MSAACAFFQIDRGVFQRERRNFDTLGKERQELYPRAHRVHLCKTLFCKSVWIINFHAPCISFDDREDAELYIALNPYFTC